ncbi:hypothetical protein MY11210_002095 [Beauveria gryllotalpidicola]
MKYSVALVSAFAAASMAGPVETRQEKKPFVERPDEDFWMKECYKGSHPRNSEFCLGTRLYCKDKYFKSQGEPFDSVQDCFRSRETPAFQEPAPEENSFELCVGNAFAANEAWRKTSEACLGTVEYCNQKIYEKDGEPFDSPKACVDSRKAV